MAERLGTDFERAIEIILACHGRVVTTGMGKSGAVARKIAGTLASTGTPALYLHPAEGVHGDLGMVRMDDLVIALSNSGDTEELNAILPALARINVPIIALTGRRDSPLAHSATVVLDTGVEREVCPFNLAPTTSTTAQIAMGDALAITVMRRRKFTSEDYALLHPRGALGRRLLLTVGDIMRTNEAMAITAPETYLKEVLFTITRAHAGAAVVVDTDGRLLGLITDGDLRRALVIDEGALRKPCGEFMTHDPRTVSPERLAAETLQTMQGPPQIGEMPVLDADGRVVGMLNLKDLLKAGHCLMLDFRCYLITDRRHTGGRPLTAALQTAAQAGIKAIQLREKDLTPRELFALAEEIRTVVAPTGARLLVNDRADIACAASLSGVHLTSSSLSPAAARCSLPAGTLVGVSTHSLAEARFAEEFGADFLTFGPVFSTPSKAPYGDPRRP